MAKLMCILVAISVVGLFSPAYSQMQTTGCTSAMLTSFAPCMNFVTNSTGNTVAPTAGCCSSLRSIMSNCTDCLCLVATGSVPFQIPINQTLALSLPRACNMARVPLQCKATASPVPIPGPAAFIPAQSPSSAAAVPSSSTSALAPEASSTSDLTPPSSSGTSGNPTTDTTGTPATGNTGSRPVLTPSAAGISYQISPFLLFSLLAATVFKSYC